MDTKIFESGLPQPVRTTSNFLSLFRDCYTIAQLTPGVYQDIKCVNLNGEVKI